MISDDIKGVWSLPDYLTLQLVSFDRSRISTALVELLSLDLVQGLRSLVSRPAPTIWWLHELGGRWASPTQEEWRGVAQSALDEGIDFDFVVADEDDWWSSFLWTGYLSRRGDHHLGVSLKKDRLQDLARAESFLLQLGDRLAVSMNATVAYLTLDGWPTWNGRVSSPLEAYYGLVGEPLVRSLRDHARGVYWANWWQRDLIASKMALVNKVVAELQPVEQRWLPGESHWYFQIADHADQVTGQRVRQWMTALQSVMPQGRPIYRVPKEWIL